MSMIRGIIGSRHSRVPVMLARLRRSRALRLAGGAVLLLIALDLAATAATLAFGAELLRR